MSTIPQAAGTALLGTLAITALFHGPKAVVILAQIVGKTFNSIVAQFVEEEKKPTPKDPSQIAIFSYQDLLPNATRAYTTTSSSSWADLGLSAVKSILVATAVMFVLHRYYSSSITAANTVLHCAVPLQLTPHHIPILKLFGI